MTRTIVALAAVAAALWSTTGRAAEKKIVYSGWDNPSTAFIRAHWQEMDQSGYDGTGIIVQLDPAKPVGTGNDLGWNATGPRVFTTAEFASAVTDMNAANWTHLTDNFLTLQMSSGYSQGLHWFEEARWATFLGNVRVMTELAKACRCKGLIVDVEHYGYSLFKYDTMNATFHPASYADYGAKVKARGAEFVRTVNAVMPDAVLLFYYSWGLAVIERQRNPTVGPEVLQYSLLEPFLNGMLAASTPGTVFVDGYEHSYGYRIEEMFREGLKVRQETIPGLLGEAAFYRERVQAGFAVWLDNGGKWDPEHTERNYFLPEEWENSLALALKYTDRYVWVYSHQAKPFSARNIPPAYREAMDRARRNAADPAWQPPHLPVRTIAGQAAGARIVKAAEYVTAHPAHNEENTFKAIWKEYEPLASLPAVWEFRIDPENQGEKLGLAGADAPAAGWRAMPVPKWWEEEIGVYDGWAWYRCRFEVPPALKGKELALAFGAVDEVARVYLNGTRIFEHNRGEYGWDVPFVAPLPAEKLRFDAANLLVVQVFDGANMGGVWKPVKLVVRRPAVPAGGR